MICKEKIKQAALMIKKGGIVIFPTDTVYGIGCSIKSEKAIKRIYNIKSRQSKKPLIVFIRYKKELKDFAESIPGDARKFINKFWPGKLTLIFKAKKNLKKWQKSDSSTIGIRIPDNPITLAIIKASGPMLTTSANFSGNKSTGNFCDIPKEFISKVDLAIECDQKGKSFESTVVDVSVKPFKILRQGAVRVKLISQKANLKSQN